MENTTTDEAQKLPTPPEAAKPTTTPEAPKPPAVEAAKVAGHVENSTDATRGEPIATRAQKRQAELQALAAKLPENDPARRPLDHAIAAFDTLLTGDITKLAHTTSADLSRLLEQSKHLGETTPPNEKA